MEELHAAVARFLAGQRRSVGVTPLDPRSLVRWESYLAPHCRHCGLPIVHGDGLFSADELRLLGTCAACHPPFGSEE